MTDLNTFLQSCRRSEYSDVSRSANEVLAVLRSGSGFGPSGYSSLLLLGELFGEEGAAFAEEAFDIVKTRRRVETERRRGDFDEIGKGERING